MFFCEVARAELKEAHPDMGFTEIAKEMGAKWKDLGVSAAQLYAAAASHPAALDGPSMSTVGCQA